MSLGFYTYSHTTQRANRMWNVEDDTPKPVEVVHSDLQKFIK